MKNSEDAVERVLAGLREAEARQGMEGRILAAVETRAAEPAAMRPRWAWPVVSAGMAALIFAGVIATVHRYDNSPTQARHSLMTSPRTLPEPGLQTASQQPAQPVRRPAKPITAPRHSEEIDPADALLYSEMRASSHPAPEAPLTNDEKLLLRAVQAGDPQVMAMLNPELRAKQEAESEAEFQAFVGQSGKGDSE